MDFAEAPPQAPRGGSNCTFGYTAAHTVYPLKCMLSPAVPSNAGAYRPFRVTAPEGSTLNCTKPAAVNTRTRTGWYIAPNLFMALGQAVPDAGPGLHRAAGLGHFLRRRRRTGASTTTTSSRAADRARLRAGRRQVRAPLADERRQHVDRAVRDAHARARRSEKSYVPDTGGAGPPPRRARPGASRVAQAARRRTARAGRPPSRRRSDADGRALRGPARRRRSAAVARDDSGARRRATTASAALVTLTRHRQILEVQLAGGSGYGDPLDRPRRRRPARPRLAATSAARAPRATTAAWSAPTAWSILPPPPRSAPAAERTGPGE